MKKFSGYEDAKKAAQFTPGERLEPGAYVCKILGVKMNEGKNGNSDYITLQFDIAEGERKGFFQQQYEADTREDKKYRGTFNLFCPLDDGSERDGWTKNTFARWITAFEQSNPGYIFQWDEKTFKGKLIGILFGEAGDVYNGKEFIKTEVRSADSIDNVRADRYYKRACEFKAKHGYTGKQNKTSDTSPAASDNDGFMSMGDSIEEELPFN